MATILLIIIAIILVMLIIITYRIHAVIHRQSAEEQQDELHHEKTGLIQGWMYAAIVLTIIVIIASRQFTVKGVPWEGHLMEWLNIVVRVTPIPSRTSCLGANFYFVFLENPLTKKA